MSATSTSDDPVDTVIDLLSGTDGTYGAVYGSVYGTTWPSGTKPDPIEKQWESTFQVKSNRNAPAAYVWSSGVGGREQRGAEYDDVVQTEVVGVDVWAIDETEVNAVSSDVVAILEDYATDTRGNTEWVTIRPTETDDRRAETVARRTDHHVVSVEVQLMRDDSTGT